MMSDVRSLKDDGLIKDNNDMKLVSDFHPRHPIFGHVGGFFVGLSFARLCRLPQQELCQTNKE
jgi:hypothetical protein